MRLVRTLVIITIVFVTGFLDFSNTSNAQIKDLENSSIKSQANTIFNNIGIKKSDAGSAPAILIGRALKVGLGIMGAIALAFYIWGGVVFMTAAGEAAKLESARNIYIWTTLGIVAILSSYVLTSFLISRVILDNPIRTSGSPTKGNEGNTYSNGMEDILNQ